MYKFLLPVVLIFIRNGCLCNAEASGTFWHISDIHVDQNYSRTGDTEHFCRQTGEQPGSDIGLYGNFLCDSPEILVNVTVESMLKYEPNPDFIMWTGDNLPHVWDPYPGWSTVFEALNNITDLLRRNFPGAKIFTSIGNHDSFPPQELLPQPSNDSIYTRYLEEGGWKNIIPEASWPTFKIGGFYSAPIRSGLRLISVNTILWYIPNEEVKDMTDPGNQFQWLAGELKNASLTNEMVYIIGHVPPGFYNKVNPHSTDPLKHFTYHPQFLKSYLNVTGKYHSVIAGQFFGHLHLDTFQVFQYGTGVPQSSSLLASSVTPWHSSNTVGGLSLPVNPSVRLVRYHQVNGSLADYEQYFLNLTEANQQEMQKPEYQLLYNFTSAYGVPDVSTTSLYKLYEKLKLDESIYELYNHHMTAGVDSAPCEQLCKTAELCAIICTSKEEYDQCMMPSTNVTIAPDDIVTPGSVPSHSSHTTLYAVMGTLIVILVVVSVIAYLRTRYRGPHSPGQYQRFFEF